MKALVLAGGRGKRLGSITESTNKCLLNIGGKPVIEYNLDRDNGVTENVLSMTIVKDKKIYMFEWQDGKWVRL